MLDAPGWTARNVMLPPLAERVTMPLERVNAAMQVAQSAASTLGPLAAGVLIAATSPAGVLYLNAATFAISAAIVAGVVSLPHVAKPRTAEDAPAGKRAVISEMFGGFRYIFAHPMLSIMVLVGIGANFLFAPLFAVVIPVYAKQLFDDPRALGLLFASLSGGMLLGTIVYGIIGPRVKRYTVLVIGGLLAPLGIWLLPVAPNLAVAVVGGVIAGLALGPINVLSMTFLQERVPQELLGRVFGSLGACTQLATPIGVLGFGFALEIISPRQATGIIAAAFTLLMLFAVAHPAMRMLDDPPPSEPTA
jgi:MFS family permease